MNHNEPITHQGHVGIIEIEPPLGRSRCTGPGLLGRYMRQVSDSVGTHMRRHADELSGFFQLPQAR